MATWDWDRESPAFLSAPEAEFDKELQKNSGGITSFSDNYRGYSRLPHILICSTEAAIQD